MAVVPQDRFHCTIFLHTVVPSQKVVKFVQLSDPTSGMLAQTYLNPDWVGYPDTCPDWG